VRQLLWHHSSDAVGDGWDVTGVDIEPLGLTSAPAGGDSGGVAYTLGYLDLVSAGGFTAGIPVAATGRVRADGYVQPIIAVEEKVAAAAFAGAGVLFTASVPDEATIEAHAARFVGEMRWSLSPDATVGEERNWDRYHEWGAGRPEGMDVVAVRHIGDVAAYLCGAGSIPACDVVDELVARPETATTAGTRSAIDADGHTRLRTGSATTHSPEDVERGGGPVPRLHVGIGPASAIDQG
jgi:hypothetical protein